MPNTTTRMTVHEHLGVALSALQSQVLTATVEEPETICGAHQLTIYAEPLYKARDHVKAALDMVKALKVSATDGDVALGKRARLNL